MRKLSKLCYTVVAKTLHRYLENDAVRLQSRYIGTGPHLPGDVKMLHRYLENGVCRRVGGVNQDFQ